MWCEICPALSDLHDDITQYEKALQSADSLSFMSDVFTVL